jgi:hypothetical protein
MELELHGARFLKNSKIALKSFKKFGTKHLDVDNYVIYYCAKNQYENPCILDSAKMTNAWIYSEECIVSKFDFFC